MKAELFNVRLAWVKEHELRRELRAGVLLVRFDREVPKRKLAVITADSKHAFFSGLELYGCDRGLVPVYICDWSLSLSHVPYSEVAIISSRCNEVFGKCVPWNHIDISWVRFPSNLSFPLALTNIPDSNCFVYWTRSKHKVLIRTELEVLYWVLVAFQGSLVHHELRLIRPVEIDSAVTRARSKQSFHKRGPVKSIPFYLMLESID